MAEINFKSLHEHNRSRAGFIHTYKAGGNHLATPVLARPVFLKIKNNISFLEKTINKSTCTSVIFGLVRLILLSYV